MLKNLPGVFKIGEVIPYLNLPSSQNGNVSVWDLKQQKNLVIIFYHGTYCPHCVEKLKEIADAYAKFEELEAEVLAVSFDKLTKLRTLAERTGIPFPLLSDETEETTATVAYVDLADNVPYPTVLITDRFGVLRYQQIASEAHELLDVEEMLSWLLLIQTECPECSPI
jgi:peroxiredoxin